MSTCLTAGSDQNVVTEMRYGPGGQLVALIAKNPVTGDQVTRYEYGVTLAESEVASNDLLRAEVYPDSSDSSDRVTYCYNRQGQRTRMRDQNGTVHEYEYDLLGRQTADKVTTLAPNIDDAVLRIGQSYEVRGMVEKVTSYSDAAGMNVVNEVQNVYNDFAQLTIQYQEHEGAVNTGTTVKVQYAYEDGSANTIRQTSMTYPSGQVLEYLYDDEAANKLSRIRTLRWDGTDVCQYSYLGLSTFVITDYLEPQIKLDYALGDVGDDLYNCFDNFNRVTNLLWQSYGTSSSSSSASSSSGGPGNQVVHLQYGYDRASNRTFRADLVAQSYDKDFDELYEYDGMQRLKKFHSGRLTEGNTVITNPTLQQGWQLDATGNWQNFTQNDQADPAKTLDQQRIANRVNEITQIARTVGADWATPEYDRNGNMTVIPQPKDMTLTFRGTWDAWNRLVKLTEPNGSGGWQTLAKYQYDGQTWRTMAKSYVSGALSETRHFYFTDLWQRIEERLGTTHGSADANRRLIWGRRYVDDLVLRDRDTGSGSLDERLYAMQDANWNVVALYKLGDYTIVERYAYSAYGSTLFLSSSFESAAGTQYEWHVLYAGYWLEASAGLYLVRYRFFNCEIGIWMSRDPIANGLTSCVFQYGASNPIQYIDPFGLATSLILIIGVPLIIIGGAVLLYRWRRERISYTPFNATQKAAIQKLVDKVAGCARQARRYSVASNIRSLVLEGTGSGVHSLGEYNAITVGKKLILGPGFYKKSLCGQLSTLLHESHRAGGEYFEEGDPRYETLLNRENSEFKEMACCLGCCHDLPQGGGTKTSDGCCVYEEPRPLEFSICEG